MKTILARASLVAVLSLVFLVLALEVVASESVKTPPTMPSEVTLTSGRVLRNVQVVRWESNRVVLKYTGGVDPIPFSLIAEPLRSQLPIIKEGQKQSPASKKHPIDRTLSGQVFVTTKGAGSYKFSGAHVYVFSASDFEAAKDKQNGNLPSNFRRIFGQDRDIAVANAWNDALANFKSVANTTTDADGNYSLKLPEGDYFIACFAGRLAGGQREQNSWVLPLPKEAARLDLNVSNQWVQPE